MRFRVLIALLFLCLGSTAYAISYWWNQMLVKPDARQSQEFFFIPGTGMVFTYTNNLVVLNSTTNASYAVTNGFPWGVLYDPAGSAHNSTNGWPWLQFCWLTNGNTVGNASSFVGTIDDYPLRLKTHNVVVGYLTPTNLSMGATANASGNAAAAFGGAATASGTSSTAVGISANSTKTGSTAIGWAAQATGLGSVAIGQSATASGDYSLAGGNQPVASGSGAVALGFQANASGGGAFCVGPDGVVAKGFGSVAMGAFADAENDGSFVFSDSNEALYTDTAVNQFVGYFSGGYYLNDATGVHTFSSGNYTSPGQVIATTGLYNTPNNNAVYVGNVKSQIGAWGFLSLTNAVNINIAATGTYADITTYNRTYTNEFGSSPTTGKLAPAVSGWYRITLVVSLKGPSPGDSMDADIMIGGTANEEIASHTTDISGANKYCNLTASGIHYLTAGTLVNIGITDTDHTGNINVLHAQLIIGSP